MTARCRLSPEEELLMLDKATKVAITAAAEAAEETARGSVSSTSIGEHAERYGDGGCDDTVVMLVRFYQPQTVSMLRVV